MLRILVIDPSLSGAGEIRAGLALAGYQLAALLADSSDLAAHIEGLDPDAILIETDSPSRETLQHLAAMHRRTPRPVVIFARDGERETIRAAVQAGVSAYVVDGLEPARIRAVVEVARARFEAQQALRKELDEVSRKLSERKLLEKAKGLLMKARGLDEDEAHHALRKLAMERSRPMVDVARDLIDMAALLR